MSVTASLSGNLQLTDNIAGNTTFLKQLVLSYTGTISSFAQNLMIGTSPVTVAIPSVSAQFLYIRNLPTTFASSLTVAWTPNGGSSETVLILSPGSAILFSETDTVNGITALTLTATAVNTPVEFILAS
jgi:hypothetical protein